MKSKITIVYGLFIVLLALIAGSGDVKAWEMSGSAISGAVPLTAAKLEEKARREAERLAAKGRLDEAAKILQALPTAGAVAAELNKPAKEEAKK